MASLVFTATSGFAVFGCSATVVGGDQGGTTQRLAIVEVRVHDSAGDGDDLVRLEASARFVSVKEPGVPADALDLLGLSWTPPPAGTCVRNPSVDRDAPGHSNPTVRVELRDISPVVLELRPSDGEARLLNLEPRAFPDVVGLVSGVVFVTPSDASALSARSPRTAWIRAGTNIPTAIELPDRPTRVTFSSETTTDGIRVVDARGLELAAHPGHADEQVVVDVVRGGTVRARCGVNSLGTVRIDADALGGTGEATLVVRAQRRVMRDDPTLGALETRVERDIEFRVTAR